MRLLNIIAMSALAAAYVPRAPASNMKQASEKYNSYKRSSRRADTTIYNTSVPVDHWNRTVAGQADLFDVKSIMDH